MIKKIKKKTFFFLIIIIFILGVILGIVITNSKINVNLNSMKNESISFLALQTEISYLNFILDNNHQCNSIMGAYYASLVHLDESRIKLENYLKKVGTEREETFYNLKKEYLVLEVQYWILAERIKNRCKGFETILYFYNNINCSKCQLQGEELTKIKEKLGDKVLIFAFDTFFKDAISLLLQRYEINDNDLPKIVINDKVYNFLNEKKILNILNES